jgi:hypothetical protein
MEVKGMERKCVTSGVEVGMRPVRGRRERWMKICGVNWSAILMSADARGLRE